MDALTNALRAINVANYSPSQRRPIDEIEILGI